MDGGLNLDRLSAAGAWLAVLALGMGCAANTDDGAVAKGKPPSVSGGGSSGSGANPSIGGVGNGGGFPTGGSCGNDGECTCQPGTSEACWSGPAEKRGIGACKDGARSCEASGEFFSWGPCVGEILPTTEIPGNGIDEDCDGSDSGGTGGTGGSGGLGGIGGIGGTPSCVPVSMTETSCDDGADDECDGKIDCSDPDCLKPGICGCGECKPGTFRYCAVPPYSHWGKEYCSLNGTYGTCTKTTDEPTCAALFDLQCCMTAGLCCRNEPSTDSVGNCPALTQCGN